MFVLWVRTHSTVTDSNYMILATDVQQFLVVRKLQGDVAALKWLQRRGEVTVPVLWETGERLDHFKINLCISSLNAMPDRSGHFLGGIIRGLHEKVNGQK